MMMMLFERTKWLGLWVSVVFKWSFGLFRGLLVSRTMEIVFLASLEY